MNSNDITILTDTIMQYLPILIPLVVIELGLMIAAVVHIVNHDKYKIGNKPLWIVIAICLNIIGPVLYFVLGRSDEKNDVYDE